MKKAALTLSLSLLIFISTTSIVEAYSLSPSGGNYQVGNSYQVQILAQPGDPGNDTSALIELIASNSSIQITNATIDPSATLSAGLCPGGANFTSSRVCFTYGNNAGIDTNDVLGTFTFSVVSQGSTSISFNTTDPIYEPSGTTDSGTIATFSLLAGSLPDTGIMDSFQNSYLLIGSLWLILGLLLICIRSYWEPPLDLAVSTVTKRLSSQGFESRVMQEAGRE